MRTESGNNRKVYCIGPVAIKFFRIYLLWLICSNWKEKKRHNYSFWFFIRHSWSDWYYKLRTSFLSNGILMNIREFLYFLFYGNDNMMPTYLSFFGIVNIQRSGKPCIYNDTFKDWYVDLIEKLEADGIENANDRFAHHFYSPDNFCYDSKGRLRMVDYGDPDTLWVLRKYPDLFEPFHKSSE